MTDTPETIYLIPGEDVDGRMGWLWCDDPAPTNDHDPAEAVKYRKVGPKHGDYTLHLTEKQAAEISHASEILARLRMGQIDMALRELPLAEPMHYEQEQYVAGYLKSLYRKDGKRADGAAWDLHQVIRHRLAWDRAYRDGIVKPGERRNWPEMMGVIYDDPLPMGGEPLARIEKSGGEK